MLEVCIQDEFLSTKHFFSTLTLKILLTAVFNVIFYFFYYPDPPPTFSGLMVYYKF